MIFSPPHLLDSDRWRGLRVGLLGGSFNPPHEGHLHISRLALQTLCLDAVWWLVTPQNPLKDPGITMEYAQRFALCRALVKEHPAILVTDIERGLGTTRSLDTIRRLKRAFPLTDFVWLSGMDIALTLHHWHRWRELLDEIATAHVARPPAWGLAAASPLKMMAGQRQVHLAHAARAPLVPRTTYWILQKQMLSVSSTALRDAEQKPDVPVS
jgi:nicotinate-nucleotide adenylyltransferase